MPSGPPKPKKYDPIKTMKKVSRDSDPHKGKRRGGFHGTPKGGKGYTRKEKHPGSSDQSNSATPEDETYRELMFPMADVLAWDMPAEGRPCGEGEDPERGHCRDPYQPSGKPSPREMFDNGVDINEIQEYIRRSQDMPSQRKLMEDPGPAGMPYGPDEYRNDPAEWDRRIQKDQDDERRHQRNWEQEERKKMGGKLVAELDWSTHKSETFDDTGEKGLHPAWGLKSIIDRGVKPHEKPSADKRIGDAENSTTKRDIPSKDFKSYSMVHAFEWSSPFSKLQPRGSNPLGGPIGGDPQPEIEEGDNA